jgi:hypothetical protein
VSVHQAFVKIQHACVQVQHGSRVIQYDFFHLNPEFVCNSHNLCENYKVFECKFYTRIKSHKLRVNLVAYDVHLTENICVLVSAVIRMVGLLILLSLVQFPSVADLNQVCLEFSNRPLSACNSRV